MDKQSMILALCAGAVGGFISVVWAINGVTRVLLLILKELERMNR